MPHGTRPAGKPDRRDKQARPKQALRPEILHIENLAAGGAGVARLADRTAVFVPGTAPGERVEAEVDRNTRPARGRLLRVIEASPDRVDPTCLHVDACGGCDFMHLSPRAQEAAHAEIVRSAVAHATGEAPPAIHVHAAPEPLGYRTRARLYVRGERGRVRIGYRAPGSHTLVATPTCIVLASSIAGALDEIPAALAGSMGEGDVQVARGAGGRLVVDVTWRGEIAPAAWTAIDRRVAEGTWAGARVRMEGAKTPAVFGDPRPVLEGADGAPLVIAAGSFAQSSDHGATLLARRVAELARADVDASREGADEATNGHVLELFAGSGTLSILLARGAASFVAVESDEGAARSARENLAARDLVGKVVATDADAYPVPPRVDVVVLDPPRAGAEGATAAIAASRVQRIVYVACDPATLARDLGVLSRAGFSLTHLETVELFPQTSHVETVARLVRRRGAR
ncbi:class I SAM-dependent RNA methyltransferase [Polyangium sorediatum]|uniref:RsmD family RNA methyltransferase n=1 Tax=Polyangium sorediatum TaxID=889274 RepID=A0ABT6PAB8_9BACT|nr:RsmD family RNA methyltransferase [Polyangium sorediatum]MDI1437578.1 RsmD family RNA methyltransferase [Polyangium sorediatum]